MKIIGIYPSSFQPPTRAHWKTYKNLKTLSGVDTFIVTTDRTPTPDAPLNFGDKEQILTRYGVPSSHIVKLDNWKNPVEVFNRFSELQTSVIFALNNKNIDEISSKKEMKNGTWFDGDKLSYFQPYEGNENKMKSLNIHGYILKIDDSTIENRPVSTKNIREVLGTFRYKNEQKKKFFRFIFGWFDIGLYTLIVSKFTHANESLGNETQSNDVVKNQQPSNNFKSNLQNLVKEVLKEIMDEDYGSLNANLMVSGNNDMASNVSSTNTQTTTTPSQQLSNASTQKINLVKQKKELEAKSKQNKQQRDNYETTVKNYDNFQKKTDRDALDAVNMQLSQPSSKTSTSTS